MLPYCRPVSLSVMFFALLGTTTFHTPPDQWEKPRLYHTEFDVAIEDQVLLGRDIAEVSVDAIEFSANKAYFFHVLRPNTSETGPWDTVLSVDNERAGLLQVVLKSHSSSNVDVKWINEKLLFIRVWWGRVVGTDLILDVEREAFIYREQIHSGNIVFQQWKEGAQRLNNLPSEEE